DRERLVGPALRGEEVGPAGVEVDEHRALAMWQERDGHFVGLERALRVAYLGEHIGEHARAAGGVDGRKTLELGQELGCDRFRLAELAHARERTCSLEPELRLQGPVG